MTKKEKKVEIYEIILSKYITKELDKFNESTYNRILAKMVELELNPRPSGCLKLSNFNEYRLRIGNYRLIYEIDDRNKIVTIYKIGHRKDIYRLN